MKIAFDAYWWASGPMSNRNVQRSIIKAWRDSFPEDEVVLFTSRGAGSRLRDELGDCTVYELNARPHRFAITGELTMRLYRHSFDAVLTHNFAPRAARVAVFVHDVLFGDHPEWFTRAENIYFRPIMPGAARAQWVITSSQAEANRISSRVHLRRPPTAVGLGLESDLLLSPPTQVRGLSSKSFYLTVGRLNARKNVPELIKALALSGAISASTPLVIVGEADGKAHSMRGISYDPSSVVWLERVTASELRWLYENTKVFVFPSLGEGYGLPPVEARSFGTPLAVSDIPVMHENLGTDAEYFEPTSPESIATAVKHAATLDRLAEVKPPTTWSEVVLKIRQALTA